MNPSQNVNYQVTRKENNFYIISNELSTSFSEQFFSPDYWQAQQAISGTAQGRGTTYFIHWQQQHWVLRHYYRGGLVGKVLTDSYLFTGIKQTRAYKEFVLLDKIQQLGLPAPKPIACQISRTGLIYRANILTARVEHAQDLVGMLTNQPIDKSLWQKIGYTIGLFHQQGVFHHDLNCHNILIDDKQKVWLIDFDQGELRHPEQSWQQQNIERLQRSFVKEVNRLATFYWLQTDFDALLTGYHSSFK